MAHLPLLPCLSDFWASSGPDMSDPLSHEIRLAESRPFGHELLMALAALNLACLGD